MYNSQNPDELYGYLCNPQQGGMEGFQNAASGRAVTLYEHCDKTGAVTPLPGVGTFTVGVHFPANASFIDVPAGFTATIYAGNLTGQSRVIKENQSFVFCSEGGWANDSIKSIVVTKSNTYDNAVTYKEGDQVSFNGSLYRLNRFIGAAGYAPSNKPQNWDNLTNPALNYKEGQPYSDAILYDAGNTVTFNGNDYRLKEFIGGAGYAPLANPNWVSLNPNYDNGVTYKQGDQVKFNGSLYRLNRFIGAAVYAPSINLKTGII
jgi:hypothetical protein